MIFPLSSLPHIATNNLPDSHGSSHHLWRERIYKRLHGQAYPLFVFADTIIPAASLWFSMREWISDFRSTGICPGDRVLLACAPDLNAQTLIAVLLASLWEGLSLALCPPGLNIEEIQQFLDVRASITPHPLSKSECVLRVHQHTAHPATPDVRLLLASSGTSAAPRWYALSDTNIVSVLNSHHPHLDLNPQSTQNVHREDATPLEYNQHDKNFSAARILSVLPLYHAFGLIIDFLPALFAGAEIVRDSKQGRDIEHILALAEAHTITHCSMVPLLAQRLAQTNNGRAMLQRLRGGVVGGAPISAALAEILRTTRLRVGYGQTEASPGITLGQPGVFVPHYLGEALGCDVRINADSILEFRGANACLGVWTANGLSRLPQNRWHSTGDIVVQSNNPKSPGYIFCGRNDDNFKLSNGRFIPATTWEYEVLRHFNNDGIKACMIAANDNGNGGGNDGEANTCFLAFSTNEDNLSLLYTTQRQNNHSNNTPPSMLLAYRLQQFIGELSASHRLVSAIAHIPHAAWQYSPKGNINRPVMRKVILKYLNSGKL